MEGGKVRLSGGSLGAGRRGGGVRVAALVLVCCPFLNVAALGAPPDWWPIQAPEGTLAGKLDPQMCWTAPAVGQRAERSFREVPGLDGLRIETAVHLAGSEGPGARDVQVLDLGFRIRSRREDVPYEALKYRDDQWYGSSFWSGPDWTRVGRDWHHPGQNTPSVRRFDVPRDGQVTVTGRVYKLHQAGDGVRLTIRHGLEDLWNAEIDGEDGRGVEPKIAVWVRRGDSLRFVVDKRGTIACDTTHWDPVVTYADGTSYQASEAFSRQQGAGGWFYEMWTGSQSPAQTPTVHALTADLSLCRRTVTSEVPVTITQEETLPFFAIADGDDRSGVVVALDTKGPWSLFCSMTEAGLLRVALRAKTPAGSSKTPPQGSIAAPACFLSAYTGPWTAGMASVKRFLSGEQRELHAPALGDQVQAAYRAATRGSLSGHSQKRLLELDLLLMAQAEWRLDDGIVDSVGSYSAAVAEHLKRAAAILARLKDGREETFLAGQEERLERLSQMAAGGFTQESDVGAWRRLYFQTRLLKREIMLSDPLLGFDAMLFCKRVPPSWSHLVAQYYGWRQRPGGGLFVLKDPGYSLACRDVLAGQLPQGSFLEPCLSYDAKRIVFSFVALKQKGLDPAELSVNEDGPDEAYFHIYEVGVDGSGLRRLTSGPYDDLMPAYLPDGRLVFCSTRRRSYSRCFGPEYSRRWDAYTIHRMDADGSHLTALSRNDVNEWFPAVSNSGDLLFARWDYIDRDAVTHQNLWAMRPDGTNPTAVWGNAAPKPNCTFQAKAVPGSTKIVFIAAAHHAITAGPVCLVDPTVDANSQEAITRVTPGPFPESESNQVPEYYESPWPLAEDRFLVAYSRQRLRFQGEHPRDPNPDNALGIYLLDGEGNRELIYRDPEISSTNPMPLVPRPRPPVLASALAAGQDGPASGEVLLSNVYEGLGDVRPGTIKELRIVQVFPKTTPLANRPLIGVAGEENARAILGTVPVEPDGSAYFTLPAGKPVLFQALDEDGFAYQTMRSSTYVQRGERVSCVGCHEHRMSAPPGRRPTAAGRPPSAIDPGELGGRPFSFVEVVQPLLDKHCVACHGGDRIDGGVDLTGEPYQGFTKSYWSLCGTHDDWRKPRGNADSGGSGAGVQEKSGGSQLPTPSSRLLVPRFWQRNQIQITPPGGNCGALGSRLIKLLRDGHEDATLNPDELRRVAAWIDMNAVFYGAYGPEEQAAQLEGTAIPMPEIQ